jgi:2'-5' RNA ligase
MRLFVAIEIAPEIRERIVAFIEKASTTISNARWVHSEGLHVTLKFLGNVADEQRSAIEDKLGSIRASRFSLAVQHVGAFPNPRSPRVLCVGIDARSELPALAEQIDSAMAAVGFEREKRAFTPHVTLARFKDPKRVDVSSVLSASNATFGTMTATQFHLYESHLSPKGSRYTKLASVPLGESAKRR